MGKISNRDLQLYMLEILKELDRVCKKHDIQYFLAYGSCLGAVRHKGFIPWDDDIDVCMKPKDYLKFMDVCKTELGEGYYFQTHFDDAKSYVFCNRIGVKNSTSINLSMSHIHQPWGICIDIFPMFPYTMDLRKQKKLQKTFKLFRLLSLKYYHVGTIKKVKGSEKLKKYVHCLIPDKINCMLFKAIYMKLIDEKGMDAKYMTTYDSLPEDGYLLSEWFEESVELEFEDRTFPCPVGYDGYLRANYGDYMQIPKDKTKHSDDPNVLIKFDECYEKYWS